MLQNTPDIMTVKDLMKVLSIGKNKALYLLNEGLITGHKIGGQWRIIKEDLLDYLLKA